MVSGADSLDTETTMYGGRAADSSSEDMEETLDNEAHCGDHSANGNTSRNGNVEEESTPEAETPSESMEVDPAQRGTGTSILSNPARFEALIRSLSLSRPIISLAASIFQVWTRLAAVLSSTGAGEREKRGEHHNASGPCQCHSSAFKIELDFKDLVCAGSLQLVGLCRSLELTSWKSVGTLWPGASVRRP